MRDLDHIDVLAHTHCVRIDIVPSQAYQVWMWHCSTLQVQHAHLTCMILHVQAEKPTPGASQSAPASKPKRSSKPSKADDNLSESAIKAIAAVAAVVDKLPSNETLVDSEKVTKMQEGAAWGAGGAEKEPPQHGSIDYPQGHPDCLCKYTIVISGVLESMMRQDAVDFVKRHGGRVTSAVSSKTSFLLCGEQSFSSLSQPKEPSYSSVALAASESCMGLCANCLYAIHNMFIACSAQVGRSMLISHVYQMCF